MLYSVNNHETIGDKNESQKLTEEGQSWWLMPVIQALDRLKQKYCECEATLGWSETLSQESKQSTTKNCLFCGVYTFDFNIFIQSLT
jgi:hypothetical protein